MSFRLSLLPLAAAVMCTACSLTPVQSSGQVAPETVPDGERMASLETALADALIQIEKLKARSEQDGGLPAMPPNAQTGACYARMLTPPKYIDRRASRIVKEATERLEMQPARTEWQEEQVVVSEAYTKLELVPATYKWVEERTEVLPAKQRQELVRPAEYESREEKILVKPAEWVWRPGRGELEKIDEETGEILHQVEIPAKYRTVERQVLVSPPEYRTIHEPAVFETVRKRVVDQPEHTVEVKVPAVYKTVKVQKVAEPAKLIRVPVPAEYEEYSYREKIADEELVWRQIPCKRDLDDDKLLRQVQKQLNERGFDAGYADGILGKRTEAAIHAFQQKQGLATGRLSVETIQSLGIAF
ncbi:peptidoglycan-binding domain-containing protein [Spongiibacter tropicus]|uniref:peptidoglycan-binding domain-containing protein n=1 Tax=Spongiibacter tropicus TaxID=454602 RepID=UPI0024E208BF|nr:peptidoglycan-binding domain-containing protein [Spongiibacter tropicus]